MSTAVDVDEVVEEALADLFGDLFEVLVLDDDHTTFETVISALMAVCGHGRPAAERLTWAVHREGSAVVFAGSLPEAEKVSASLSTYGLRVRVQAVGGDR